jgi:hypothetical protein
VELITKGTAFKTHLTRLFATYPHVSLSVAWASANTEVFNSLVAHAAKVTHAVIGTHFYQTHPDVLDCFVDSATTKFMLQPTGIFHPKVYCFHDGSNREFEIVIGSANFTHGAMTVNTELSTLITHKDGQPELLDQTLAFIEAQFKEARTVSQERADNYRKLWKLRQPELKKLEGQYGETKSGTAPVDMPLMTMDWDQYLTKVKADRIHNFQDRLELLLIVRKLFSRTPRFADMNLEERKAVAGMDSKIAKDAKWFGSMKGVGYFKQAINNNNVHLSNALDKIPLTGEVNKAQYDAFIEEYLKAFPNGRAGIGTSSRLLALKRPDYFICVDSKNRDKLTEEFDIRKSGIDYDRYWFEIVGRLIDTPWWRSLRPSDPVELEAWLGRAAMLDALFYVE